MTAEEFDRLPEEDGRRYELIEGELIDVSSATPTHNRIVRRLLHLLELFLAVNYIAETLPDTEFIVGQSRLRPDVAIMLLPTWDRIDPNRVPVPIVPEVAVEVVSPSESYVDVEQKVRTYLNHGVVEVWLVQPQGRSIYVHRSTEVQWLPTDEHLQTPLLPGFSLAIADLFATPARPTT